MSGLPYTKRWQHWYLFFELKTIQNKRRILAKSCMSNLLGADRGKYDSSNIFDGDCEGYDYVLIDF
jgi:hypothetical protein